MKLKWSVFIRKRLWNIYFVWFLFSSFTVVTFILLHTKHPGPLVDEVFHVPQAMNYCAGEYLQWNPKITTLPGLYFGSVLWLKSFGLFFGLEIEHLCNIYGLRLFNVLVSIANFILIYKVQRQISTLRRSSQCTSRKKMQKTAGRWCDGRKCSADKCKWRDLATTLNMSLFPVLYFFSFFYYTEQLSTFTVLMTYSLGLSGRTRVSAVVGLVSILVRQSNVIWIGFILLNQFISLLQRDMISTGEYSAILQKEDFFEMIMAMGQHNFISWWRRRDVFVVEIKRFIDSTRDYMSVCAIFIVFVMVNGGIVVGDKLAHNPVFHFPQVLYFILFTSAFCIPYFMLLTNEFLSWLRQKYMRTLVVSTLIVILVYQYTLAHPYLLADNRHYTFYVWKLLFEHNQILKYLLIPVYVYGGFCITHYLGEHSFAYKTSYLICVCLILIPQKLLEFRYFIAPFLIFRLNVYPKYEWQLWFEFCIHIILNMATFYLFYTREIYWADIAEVQRLMW